MFFKKFELRTALQNLSGHTRGKFSQKQQFVSGFLIPDSAKLVHTPSHKTQNLIANVIGNKLEIYLLAYKQVSLTF